MRLSVEEVPATPAMASMLMVIHLMQRSVLRRPDTETCAVRSAHASREVLDRSLSCGRSVDAIGAPQRLRCQLPHIGASGAPAASNEACWCATATPTGQSKPTGRETPFFHTVGGLRLSYSNSKVEFLFKGTWVGPPASSRLTQTPLTREAQAPYRRKSIASKGPRASLSTSTKYT